MTFLGENYLLDGETAVELYRQVKDLPIVDAHNHGDVKEIVDNKSWNDIWEVEGATDHYVWELMRKVGVPEEKITGSASNKEKWLALAEVFPLFVGNPTYEWIHLDLKRRFKIDEVISKETAELIWHKTSSMLKTSEMKPQYLLRDMNIEIMCTTDDPVSDLEFHLRAQEEIKGVKILPTWRPDKAMNIELPGWHDYVRQLGDRFNSNVDDFVGFLSCLQQSHQFFVENGCVASDHGLLEPVSYQVDQNKVEEIYKQAVSGEGLSREEVRDFKSFMLCQFGEMNSESGWVTQLHIGAVRNYRNKLLEDLGPDTGGDLSTNQLEIADNLKYFLNQFDERLKVVLYCLDYTHVPTLATLSRAFPNVTVGAPWWFNDSPYGMEEHLKYIATIDLLSTQAGMVTDSRKLISYGSRTEMFRRILCSVVGKMVDRGQMPFKEASTLVANLSYYRPLELFF